MKIGDYLGRLKYQSLLGRNAPSDQSGALSPFKRFEEILSFCKFPMLRTRGAESTRLKIPTYLAKPFPLKSYETSLLEDIKLRHTETSPCDFYLSRYMDSLKRRATPEGQKGDNSQMIYNFDDIYSNESAGTALRQKIDQSVKKAAITYKLPPHLINGVIKAESDFCVRAVSSAGARGLMQLMPGTIRELGIKDPFDIDQNIDGGARYLRQMLDLFGGDIRLALAAYNAGPRAVERYKGIPPYRETKLFVDQVLKFSSQMA